MRNTMHHLEICRTKRPVSFGGRTKCSPRRGYFIRLRSANGKIIWRTSEAYRYRRGALRAIGILNESFVVRDLTAGGGPS